MIKDCPHELVILGETILPGEERTINFNMAKLYTSSVVEVPVIINRSKEPGPLVFITGGIHGDEVNGVEVVRQVLVKNIHKPKRGTIMCMPILNIFGFLNGEREFPDGRDLNRMFPGTAAGSLASRFAHKLVTQMLGDVSLCLDFHTGGAQRFNAAQIRVDPSDTDSLTLARKFGAPFTIYSKVIKKSYRGTAAVRGIPYLLFEGGKSLNSDKEITLQGLSGVCHVLDHLGMLHPQDRDCMRDQPTILVEKTRWMRASYSGLFHPKVPIGRWVDRNEYIATITDPFGKFRHKVRSKNAGWLICINESPLVHQGDAIFHISTQTSEPSEAEDSE